MIEQYHKNQHGWKSAANEKMNFYLLRETSMIDHHATYDLAVMAKLEPSLKACHDGRGE